MQRFDDFVRQRKYIRLMQYSFSQSLTMQGSAVILALGGAEKL
jgi:hypothetical protein